MIKIEKQHVPLLLLLLISVTASFYYLNNGVWNDYGQTKPEWMLLIDGLLFLPLVCFYCIDDKKQAALKAVVYASLMVLLGSYLIPDGNKQLWHYLESGRFVVIALFVVFEVITMLTVFFAIKASLSKTIDPDSAIIQPIEKLLGQGKLANLMAFEARAWVYTLFPNRVDVSRFRGDLHFHGHLKDGTQSNLLGFIIIILFGLPLEHLLLHFIWSPFAANVITGMMVFSLVFFVAEYRAISRRPVSIDQINRQLIIRYGLFAPLLLSFEDIVSVSENSVSIPRAKAYKRYNLFGSPNVKITDQQGHDYFLGLNQAAVFIEALQQSIKKI